MRAVVLREGKLEVRETADPVPGPGELLIKPLSAAICASDVHYMDHPNSADRFVWDSGRDTVMGHEFIGEVVGHGPDCSGDFPVGARVTSLPIMIRHGQEPLVIGHNPTLHELALFLTGRVDELDHLPTGAFASLAFEGSWADLGEGGAELESFVVPREL